MRTNQKKRTKAETTYVLTVSPGKRSACVTLQESKEILGKFAQHEKVSTVPTFDLAMVYDERSVLTLGNEQYLVGPAVIYAPGAESDALSLTQEDRQLASRIMEIRTVTLWADGKEFPAFHL